ncbi:MAG: mannose-1-phosphate guanylyltransferase, mannose-1-phosphate guanylyltransferase [Candidatus Peregrinibacteria bacterium GW2011_GWE2_39_6]|nr:MAG: mannose-1-phosphate guanylyltransferase, mannose-1-phosphate guanylyltransferase [Candidatus Peregrinibacteria bacterium GW2011_GWF2_39_17]KKR24715.1 MAG: mannose-1-phosphate guanylyltransferase, mannose-1-phosphate guanylyltransferase [Candidatus Peregrinibacteria bacterium GW2011_GWE2_39_6]HCW31993.1 mannose-1-phosphate guanylyltransferase [Candidatus Peregrinibacteria bacterium]
MKAVILAGGTGTRLWPLSRLKKPKQFQKFTSNKTLFQETVARLSFLKPKDIYVATNQAFLNYVQTQAPQIPNENIIIEPALRDTASCIGLAAAVIAKQFPNEVMAVIYADHLIKNKKEFAKKLKIAEQVAKEDETLNIIEVKAKFPNINLGYVKIGKMLKTIKEVDIFSFEKFIEKPDLKTAQKFLQSYKYLWNTGYYVWKVSTILEAYQAHLPETYRHLMAIQEKLGTTQEKATLKQEYPLCEKISIDYGIMEKVDPKIVRIIPADLGWSDIGTWRSLHQELVKNPTANFVNGEFLAKETHGSVLYNTEKEKMIAVVGMENVAVVNTKDAILICNLAKDCSPQIKKVVEILKTEGREDLL